MASLKKSEYVLDEIVYFLSNPFFQIPVLSFMESKCLIFDPSIEDYEAYLEIHAEYNKLVDLLLEGFRTDTGLSHDQIIQAMKELNSKPDLRDVFHVLFEQVLATVDYRIFVRIMAQKNLELQQQALLLISQMLGGSLPESLLKEAPGDGQWSKSQHHSKDEDEIFLAVLAQSKEEYEREKKRTNDEQEELRIIIGIPHSESARLEHSMKVEQERLNETFKKSLTLNYEPQTTGKTATVSSKPTLSKSASIPPPASYQPKRQSSTTTAPKQIAADHTLGAKDSVSAVSSSDAAAAWMKSAETEMNASDAHSKAVQAAAAGMAGMSGEEYKRRVEFLRQQRDKLMEMKRKERGKQLLSAEKSQPQRPASARAARVALKQGHGGSETSPEDEKKLAMRRAIADRIKSELMAQNEK